MGTFIYRIPWKSGIKAKFYIIGDPKVARTILEHPKTTKLVRWYKAIDNISDGGKTFFSQNGKRAMHVRKSTASAFSVQNVKRMSEIIETIVDTWVTERLEPLYVKPNNPFDVDREIVLIATEVIFQVGFDYKLSDPDRDFFVRSMRCALNEFGVNLNILKEISLTAWMFPGVRKARRAAKDMVQVCAQVLEAYRKNPNPDTNTLIHMLANDPEYESDDERTRDMVAIVFGGFDTTAHTIAWTLLELARTPEEQTRVRSALSKCPSKEESRKCQELKNVTREILRLHTVVALGSTRVPGSDVYLPGNKVITAGSICLIPYYLILRNDNYFDNPDSFVPSRWNNPSEESLRAFMPFSLGRRGCAGQALAHEEITIILSRLLTEYEFRVAEEGKKEYMITLKTVGTRLWVKAIKN
jgi:cytochrome P450